MQGGDDRELGEHTKMSSKSLLWLFARRLLIMSPAARLFVGAEALISLESRKGFVEVGRGLGTSLAQGLLKGELRGEGEAPPPPKRL